MDSILSSHEIGEGLPVLIIHGWELSGRAEELELEPIFTREPQLQLRRVYVDLPGMGKTPANNIKNQNDIYLRLVQFIDSRFGKSRFLLIGTSCGGYLSRALALRYREQIDGMLLRVPLIEPDDRRRDLDTFEPLIANEQLMSSMSDRERQRLGSVLVQTPDYVKTFTAKNNTVWRPSAKLADKKLLDAIRWDPERYSLPFSLDGEDAKFVAPTLIVCGRQDDNVGYRDALRLLELYPRSTYAVLDAGTHGLPLGDAQNSILEALVRDWVIRVNEWRSRPDGQVVSKI